MTLLPPVDPRPDAPAFAASPETWPPSAGPRLRGEWVELAVSVPDDAASLFAALDGPSVWTHVVGRPATAPDMARQIATKLADAGWLPFTVRLLRPIGPFAAGEIVGTTSFLEVVPSHARGEIGSTTYSPLVWGSAVNPECKLLLLQYSFETLGWARVQFKTDVRNMRSRQAIAKLGAVYEGLLRQFQPRPDGSQRDSVLFSITVDEWPGIRNALQERLASIRSA